METGFIIGFMTGVLCTLVFTGYFTKGEGE